MNGTFLSKGGPYLKKFNKTPTIHINKKNTLIKLAKNLQLPKICEKLITWLNFLAIFAKYEHSPDIIDNQTHIKDNAQNYKSPKRSRHLAYGSFFLFVIMRDCFILINLSPHILAIGRLFLWVWRYWLKLLDFMMCTIKIKNGKGRYHSFYLY